MPVEPAGARTWLLGAVALWALATWLLGLAGLGGRIERLPSEPGQVQDLPAVVQPGEARPGPLAQYAETSARPLFTSGRRPEAFIINPEGEEAPAGFDYVLTSVLISPPLEVAIVQPAQGGESVRVKVGEAAAGAPDWRLESLEPRRAVFEGPEGRRVLELRVFDGVGGESPTAISVAPGMSQPTQQRSVIDPMYGQAGNGVPASPTTSPPPQPTPAIPVDASAAPSSEEQVEAIRRRIEERRARMREQGQPPEGSP